ncbi:hypothetical protein JCM10295v2_001917 [Rhodotorula toruloides]
MATIGALPKVVASFGAAISSLPSQLVSTTNVPLLSSQLSHLAADLSPALPTLGAAQQEALLSNATWLAGQTSLLSSFVARLPAAERNSASHDELLALIQIASTRYDLLTVWTPDVWSLLFLFLVAILLKTVLSLLLSPSAVRRARGALRGKYGVDLEGEVARSALQKPARSALGHILNLLVSIAALIFQLLAWRLFVLGSQPMRLVDYQYFLVALKLVLLSYAVDLVFGDVRPEIFLHHTFTFLLMFVGQIAAYETKSPKFFRFAQYMLLQATLEQSTYLAMFLYHFSTYLRMQDHRPDLQARCIKVAHKLLVFTTWITWVQKIGPAAFALYWIGSMWRDVDGMDWGKTWLVWSTIILALLLLLQTKFCDDVKPLADYVGYKFRGGRRPHRIGPVMRLLLATFTCRPNTECGDIEEGVDAASEENKTETVRSSPAFKAPVRLVHNRHLAAIVSLDNDGRKRTTTLAKVLEQCKSLTGKDAWYTPTAWLASGHLATIACTLFKFDYDHIHYTRELIRVPDGGTIAVDIAPALVEGEDMDDRPILVVSHGLTGGSHESYVRNILAVVTRPKEQGGLGWRAAVVNSRGCANSPVTSRQLYNGAVTDDLRSALTFLSHFAPDAPLYGIGFSLGANQQAKFVGEEGQDCPYNAAVVLGAPFDFWKGHIALSSTWLRSIYSRAMSSNLRRLVARHEHILKGDPRLDWDAIFSNPNSTLFEFDSLVTAPLSGFRTAVEYYRHASASNVLHHATVPVLAISAQDDPIVCSGGVPLSAVDSNPNLIFCLTKHGGHLGWFEGFSRPRRWVSKPVVEFLKAVHEANSQKRQMRETVPARTARRPQVGDEMVVLKGREQVGFKRVGVEDHQANGDEAEDGANKLTQGL